MASLRETDPDETMTREALLKARERDDTDVSPAPHHRRVSPIPSFDVR